MDSIEASREGYDYLELRFPLEHREIVLAGGSADYSCPRRDPSILCHPTLPAIHERVAYWPHHRLE